MDRLVELEKGEEKRKIRWNRSCQDQFFVVSQVRQWKNEKKNVAYQAFMDLEKTYDGVEGQGFWLVLKLYGKTRKSKNSFVGYKVFLCSLKI